MEKPHKKLIAWQKCMDLVVLIYEITKDFPKEETYGLVSQMRRASVSAPSNIAEGAADRSTEQFKNFLSFAIGSLNELNTQIEIAFRIGYLNQSHHDKAQKLVDECLAVTYGLKRSIGQNKLLAAHRLLLTLKYGRNDNPRCAQSSAARRNFKRRKRIYHRRGSCRI